MVEKGVGLEFERQEADARLKEARAEHARAGQAAALLGTGKGIGVTVRAPAEGVVMTIRVAAGAMVAPGGEALLEGIATQVPCGGIATALKTNAAPTPIAISVNMFR